MAIHSAASGENAKCHCPQCAVTCVESWGLLLLHPATRHDVLYNISLQCLSMRHTFLLSTTSLWLIFFIIIISLVCFPTLLRLVLSFVKFFRSVCGFFFFRVVVCIAIRRDSNGITLQCFMQLAFWTQIIPGLDRERMHVIEFCFELQPASTVVTISVDVSKTLLYLEEYPPDAHRGFDISPTRVTVARADTAGQQLVQPGCWEDATQAYAQHSENV